MKFQGSVGTDGKIRWSSDRMRSKDHKFMFESGLNRYQSSVLNVLMLSLGHLQQAKVDDQMHLNV